MNKKRRKRKEIVNYCVKGLKFRGYTHEYLVGSLIISKSHPMFMLHEYKFREIARTINNYFYVVDVNRGNCKSLYRIHKKKFRNLNYCILSLRVWSDYLSKKDFTDSILQIRSALIMEYIREKRKEG